MKRQPAIIRYSLMAGVLFASWFGLYSASPADENTPAQAYVIMGTDGNAIARYLTNDKRCPDIRINGESYAMQLRSGAQHVAQRPTVSPATDSKPSIFSQQVCEYRLPANTRSASIAGQALPLPHADVRRVVVIGDTGCRIKAHEPAQACDDRQKYPFATIASLAAEWHPDLVIHVGDYLYRENACPEGNTECAGSPWGYGSDSWQADFFQPAHDLLNAAPWIVVRGNHESCNRAGQGWWRFLDPHPLTNRQNCDLAKNDAYGDYAGTYAVPLGGNTQVIVMDTAIAPKKALDRNDPRWVGLRQAYVEMLKLAAQASANIIASHQPVLAFAAKQTGKTVKLSPGNQALQSVFQTEGQPLYPDQVDLLLSGHVHTWEQLSFANDYPSQFVTGFSGTEEEITPIPDHLPTNASPAPGAQVSAFSTWNGGFGYMTLERTGPASWQATVHDVNNRVIKTCVINGKHSRCNDASDYLHP